MERNRFRIIRVDGEKPRIRAYYFKPIDSFRTFFFAFARLRSVKTPSGVHRRFPCDSRDDGVPLKRFVTSPVYNGETAEFHVRAIITSIIFAAGVFRAYPRVYGDRPAARVRRNGFGRARADAYVEYSTPVTFRDSDRFSGPRRPPRASPGQSQERWRARACDVYA